MDYNSITCPSCHDSNMAPIIYGFPTPEMIDLARKDMVALGGLNFVPDGPTHYCYSCHEVAALKLSSE